MEDVVVSDEYRGRQLGKYLVTVAVLLAARLNCYKVTLNCKDNMIRLYNFNQSQLSIIIQKFSVDQSQLSSDIQSLGLTNHSSVLSFKVYNSPITAQYYLPKFSIDQSQLSIIFRFYNGLGFKCEEGDANFMVIRLWTEQYFILPKKIHHWN